LFSNFLYTGERKKKYFNVNRNLPIYRGRERYFIVIFRIPIYRGRKKSTKTGTYPYTGGGKDILCLLSKNNSHIQGKENTNT